MTSESSSARRVQAHRQRLREQGLRPIQIWVPDTRSREFSRQAHAQSVAVAVGQQAAEDQTFIDGVSVDFGA